MSQNITNYIGKILNSIQKIESLISTILVNIGNIGENEGSLVYKEIDVLNTNIQNIISSLFDSVLIGEYLDKEIDIVSTVRPSHAGIRVVVNPPRAIRTEPASAQPQAERMISRDSCDAEVMWSRRSRNRSGAASNSP